MLKYTSLIIDIENSRGYNIEDRNEMQEFMLAYIKILNKIFSVSIQFDVTFSAGDEMQGLFRDTTSAIQYLRLFEMMVRPVRIRAGIGIGEWNVKVEDGLSTHQDGPTYHRARQAIEEVHRMQTQRYRICSELDDTLANYLLNTSCILKEQQVYMQNIALIVMELLYPFTKNNLIIYSHDVIKDLLKIKCQSKIGRRRSFLYKGLAEGKDTENDLHEELLYVRETIDINGGTLESEEIVIKKSMSSNIAEVLGCKRQNVDMLIKRGNSIAIRNMDYVALQFVEREYKKYGI